MRRIVLLFAALVVAVLAAGSAYLWAAQRGRQELAASLARVRTALGPGGSLTWQAATVAPFSRAATLTGVAARDSSGDRLTARLVTVTARGPVLTHALARDVRVAAHAGAVSMTARSVEAWSLGLPAAAADPRPAPGRLAVDDLRLALSNGRLSVAHLAGSGTDLGADLAAATGVPAPGASATGSSSFEFRDIAYVGANTSALTIRRLQVTREATPDRLVGAAALTGIDLVDPDWTSRLRQIGLDRLAADLSEHVELTRRGGVVDLAPARLDVAGLGTMALDVDLDDVDLADARAASGATDIIRLLEAARLVGLHLAWRDAGLLDRCLALAARQSATTTQQARAAAAAAIAADPRLAILPDAGQSRAALAGFIAHGGTLTVDLRPPAPVSLATLVTAAPDPALAMARLGLAITTHAPPATPPAH